MVLGALQAGKLSHVPAQGAARCNQPSTLVANGLNHFIGKSINYCHTCLLNIAASRNQQPRLAAELKLSQQRVH